MRVAGLFRRAVIVAVMASALEMPLHGAPVASAAAPLTIEGVPVAAGIERVSLSSEGTLHGAVLDADGQPVVGTKVLVGQTGQLIAEVETDSMGRFAVPDLPPGVFQIVSHAQAQNCQLYAAEHAPADAKRGVIHVMPSEVARAQRADLRRILTTPAFFVVGAMVGGVLAIVLTDDDDAS